jgi:hypothetical protein
MTFSEETLMAYADNELDAPTRAAVESAMAVDPEIAERVARHQALRGRLRSTFDKVLDEPPPDRLIAAARGAPAVRREGNVIPLRRNPAPPRWSWPQWGSIAASLTIGVFVGQMLFPSAAPGPITTRNGQLVASGVLAHALSDQLASNQTQAAPVRIGVSFKSKLGEYCRTFVVRESTSVAGLACRERADWRVQVMAQGESGHENGSQLRPAGSSLPRSVLQAVDDAIAGEPLDASAEAAARSRGWRR